MRLLEDICLNNAISIWEELQINCFKKLLSSGPTKDADLQTCPSSQGQFTISVASFIRNLRLSVCCLLNLYLISGIDRREDDVVVAV